MGNPDIRTPALNELAERSTVFERLYVASPSCALPVPMLSGLMPFRNGAEPNHTHVRDDVRQLPHYMRDLGYEVATIGKIAHGTDDRAGFDYVDRDISLENIGIVSDYPSQRKRRAVAPDGGNHDPHVPWPNKPFPHYKLRFSHPSC